MPKKTHKLKKVIHPNRYFIWAIAVIFISATALTAYIQVSSYSFDRLFVFSELAFRKVYTDHQAGYSVRYPRSWVLERETDGSTLFENPDDSAETISVYAANLSAEPLIRKSLQIQVERDVAKGDLKIDLIQSGAKKNGDENYNVAIVKTDSKLFYIVGYSPTFEQFVNNFRVE